MIIQNYITYSQTRVLEYIPKNDDEYNIIKNINIKHIETINDHIINNKITNLLINVNNDNIIKTIHFILDT